MDYTTTSLIAGLKGKINVPTAQGLYPDDAAFLSLIDRELRSRVVAFVLSLRQDFLLIREEIPIVAGQTAYDLPQRMFSPSEIRYRSGNSTDNVQNEFSLEPIQPGNTNTLGYYFLNEKVVVSPSGNWQAIVVYYYRRPGFLVTESAAAQITAISGTDYTVSSVPSSFTTGVIVDTIEGNPPFRPIDDSISLSTVVGNVINFSTTPATNLAVGDWIALETESPIAQIPYEAFHYLELASALRVLMATGYTNQYQMAMKDLQQLESDLKKILFPRADRQSHRITQRPFNLNQYGSRRSWIGPSF